jgi:hypothetical protein
VPPDHRLRLHDDEVLLPVVQELARHRPERAVRVLDPRPFDAALVNGQLLPQRHVLEREARAVGRERA